MIQEAEINVTGLAGFLLAEYSDAARRLAPPLRVQVAVTWRDVIDGTAEVAARRWSKPTVVAASRNSTSSNAGTATTNCPVVYSTAGSSIPAAGEPPSTSSSDRPEVDAAHRSAIAANEYPRAFKRPIRSRRDRCVS